MSAFHGGGEPGLRRVDFRFLLETLPESPIAWDSPTVAAAVRDLSRYAEMMHEPDAVFTQHRAGPVPDGLRHLPSAVESSVLRRPGDSARWLVIVSRDRPVAYVPANDSHLLREALRHWLPARALPRLVKGLLMLLPLAGRVLLPQVHVKGLGGSRATPALVSAACALGADGAMRAYLLTAGGSERRRVTALLYEAGSAKATFAVKLERHPNGRVRADAETAVCLHLASMEHGPVTVPRQIGAGELGRRAIIVEEAAPGQPASGLLTSSPAAGARAVDVVVQWLQMLASQSKSSSPVRVPIDVIDQLWSSAAVSVRSAAERLALAHVPSVLAHGNLADAGNVLVDDDGHVSVIDWETAQWHSGALNDLLPLMVNTLTVLETPGRRAVDARVREAINIVTGHSRRSGQLFATVHRHLQAVGIDPGHAGDLALCAVIQQGVGPLLHDQLLRQANLPAPAWTSFSTRFAQAWLAHEQLGPAWSAFGQWRPDRGLLPGPAEP